MAIGSVAELVVFVKGDLRDFQEKMHTMGSTIEAQNGKLAKAGAVGGKVLLGGVAAAAGAAVFAIDVATKEQAAQALLANALKNTGTSYSKQKDAIEESISTGEKFGQTDEETQRALAKGVTALGSMEKAHKALSMAQDYSAVTGKSMSASMLLAIKGIEGNTGALKRSGVDLPIVASNAMAVKKAFASVYDSHLKVNAAFDAYNAAVAKFGPNSKQAAAAANKLASAQDGVTKASKAAYEKLDAGNEIAKAWHEKFGGAATAASKTFEGQLKRTKAEVEDFAGKMGQVLLPIVQKVMTAIMRGTNFLMHHKEILIALGVVVGGVLTAAFIAWAASLFLADGALAFLVSPITAVVLAIGALVLGVYELYTHWNEVWNFMSHNKAIGALILLIGTLVTGGILPLILAGIYLYKHWSTIWPEMKRIAMEFFNFFKPAIMAVVAVVKAVIKFVEDLIHGNWSKLWADFVNIVKTMAELLWAFLITIPGRILGLLGRLVGLLLPLGIELLKSLWQGAVAGAELMWAFLLSIPGRILELLVSLATLLIQSGIDLLTSLFNGAVSGAEAVWGFLTALPGRIVSTLGSLLGTLVSAGTDLISGMLNGAINEGVVLAVWVSGLPSGVISSIGDLGGLLLDAGKALIGGFLDGIKAAWHEVEGFLGGLADAAKSLKGPPAYDAVVLRDNGRLMMQGFQTGLSQGWGLVQTQLKGYSSSLGGMLIAGPTFSTGGSRAASMAYGAHFQRPGMVQGKGDTKVEHHWNFITTKDLDSALAQAPTTLRVRAKTFLTTGSMR